MELQTAMSALGRIEAFKREGDTWPAYTKRVSKNSEANNVVPEKEKNKFLATMVLAPLCSLIMQEAPQDEMLDVCTTCQCQLLQCNGFT